MKMRHAVFGVLLLAGSLFGTAGAAALEQQGMGAARPATKDVSQSPRWHVYRFIRDGINYVQVNDLGNQVRMGVATANGLYLVLPMGSDAGSVSTPDAPVRSGQLSHAEVVYRDGVTQVAVAVNGKGQYVWSVTSVAGCDPDDCPVTRIQAAPAATLCDPNDCPVSRIQAAPAAALCDANDCPVSRAL